MPDNDKYRFLIIDDIEEYAEALTKILEHEFYGCKVFYSKGDDIVKKAIDEEIDLIFLDIKGPLPDESPIGLETYRGALSGNIKTKDIPVIFITSEKDPAKYQKWLDHILNNNPNDDFILKDVIGNFPRYFKFRVIHSLTQFSKIIPKTVDIAIVCALESELDSLVKVFGLNEVDDDPWINFSGDLKTSSDKVIHIVASHSGMGIPKCTSTAMSLCLKYKPKILAMTGIAAGVGEGMSIGDVLLPDVCWNYDEGKIIEEGDQKEVKFFARMSQLPTNENVKTICKKVYKNFLEEISQPLSDILSEKARRVTFHLGPFASGSSVISSEKYISDKIKTQHSKMIGFDMEAFGIYLAAKRMEKEMSYAPIPVVLKSVSDMGENKEKLKQLEKINQRCSAFTSAIFLKKFLELYDF